MGPPATTCRGIVIRRFSGALLARRPPDCLLFKSVWRVVRAVDCIGRWLGRSATHSRHRSWRVLGNLVATWPTDRIRLSGRGRAVSHLAHRSRRWNTAAGHHGSRQSARALLVSRWAMDLLLASTVKPWRRLAHASVGRCQGAGDPRRENRRLGWRCSTARISYIRQNPGRSWRHRSKAAVPDNSSSARSSGRSPRVRAASTTRDANRAQIPLCICSIPRLARSDCLGSSRSWIKSYLLPHLGYLPICASTIAGAGEVGRTEVRPYTARVIAFALSIADRRPRAAYGL